MAVDVDSVLLGDEAVSEQLECDANLLAGALIVAGAGVHWLHRWYELRRLVVNA